MPRALIMNSAIEFYWIVMDHRGYRAILPYSERISSEYSSFLQRIKLYRYRKFIDEIFSTKKSTFRFISIRQNNSIIHKRNILSREISILCKQLNPSKIFKIVSSYNRISQRTTLRYKFSIQEFDLFYSITPTDSFIYLLFYS